MRNNFFLKNQAGSVLIDAMMGAAIIIVVMLITASGINQLDKTSKKFQIEDSADKQVNQIIESVRTGLEDYQVNYNYLNDGTATYSNPLLEPSNLAMAWDSNIQATASECPTCKGRYGFIIQPYEKYRGLFLVTLRITHQKWPTPKDYQFVVSAK